MTWHTVKEMTKSHDSQRPLYHIGRVRRRSYGTHDSGDHWLQTVCQHGHVITYLHNDNDNTT